MSTPRLILRPSGVHGIGLFTLDPIKKGEIIPGWDNDRWRLVTVEEAASDPILQQMCNWFCVLYEDGYGCPTNFSSIQQGWYINHSEHPNTEDFYDPKTDGVYNRALRDIEPNEELTLDYLSLSDLVVKQWPFLKSKPKSDGSKDGDRPPGL